jgi:hypothetical protein
MVLVRGPSPAMEDRCYVFGVDANFLQRSEACVLRFGGLRKTRQAQDPGTKGRNLRHSVRYFDL